MCTNLVPTCIVGGFVFPPILIILVNVFSLVGGFVFPPMLSILLQSHYICLGFIILFILVHDRK